MSIWRWLIYFISFHIYHLNIITSGGSPGCQGCEHKCEQCYHTATPHGDDTWCTSAGYFMGGGYALCNSCGITDISCQGGGGGAGYYGGGG